MYSIIYAHVHVYQWVSVHTVSIILFSLSILRHFLIADSESSVQIFSYEVHVCTLDSPFFNSSTVSLASPPPPTPLLSFTSSSSSLSQVLSHSFSLPYLLYSLFYGLFYTDMYLVCSVKNFSPHKKTCTISPSISAHKKNVAVWQVWSLLFAGSVGECCEVPPRGCGLPQFKHSVPLCGYRRHQRQERRETCVFSAMACETL